MKWWEAGFRQRERENPPYVTGHPEDRNTALDERQDWIQNKSEAFDVLRTGRSYGCCWSFIRHSARGVHLHAVCPCSCSSLPHWTWRQVDISTGAKRMSWAAGPVPVTLLSVDWRDVCSRPSRCMRARTCHVYRGVALLFGLEHTSSDLE